MAGNTIEERLHGVYDGLNFLGDRKLERRICAHRISLQLVAIFQLDFFPSKLRFENQTTFFHSLKFVFQPIR